MSFEIGDRVEVFWPTNCCGSDHKKGLTGILMRVDVEEQRFCLACRNLVWSEPAWLAGHDLPGASYRLRKLPPLVDELMECLEEGEEILKAAQL